MVLKTVNKIWVPDLYFTDGQSAKRIDITKPNYLLRVSSKGEVLLSQHIEATIFCGMNFRWFPFDSQV